MTTQRSSGTAHQPHIAKDLLFLIELEKNLLSFSNNPTNIKLFEYLLSKLESSTNIPQMFLHLLNKPTIHHFTFQLLENDPSILLKAFKKVVEETTTHLTSEIPSLDSLLEEAPPLPINAETLCEKLIILESRLHVKLVWQQANKFAGRYPSYDASDLVGWGWQGLRIALRKFEPSKGWAFSTYACTRIGGSIRDGVRSESPLPKRLTTYVHSVNTIKEQLTNELNRQPSQAELLARLGGPSREFRMLPRLGTAVSLDELIPGSENTTIASNLTTGETPESTVLQKELAQAAFNAIEELAPEDFCLIKELILEKRTYKEVAASLQISVRALKDRKDRILEAVRNNLDSWELVNT
jgi:RNA polymerase sigma factor (sigma-70 family)